MVYSLTAPTLDMLILSIISRDDSYGYQISQQIKTVSSMKDSALYPILKKLSDNGYVDVYDQQFQGRNRRYYRITDNGKLQFHFLYENWRTYIDDIEQIVNIKEDS